MTTEKKILLIDGMALAYRGHFALMRNPRVTTAGINTSAVFIFLNTMLELIKKEEPTHVAVAFDTKEPTRRHKEFPEYKAQREAMPEELAIAIPYIEKICAAFQVPVIKMPGYEADDIVGTLTLLGDQQGFTSLMVTPDKDYAQLVSPTSIMYKPGRKGGGYDVLGVKEVCETWGIERVDQVIDILGLMGDSSDNIPGVPGIGQKTAQKLIADYGSFAGIYEHIDELKGKRRENLENFKEQGALSRHLVTIDRDVPITCSFDDLVRKEMDQRAVKELFAELEFRTLAKRLFGNDYELGDDLDSETEVEEPATRHDTFHRYHLVESEDEIADLLDRLGQQRVFCFDFETTGLDARHSDIVGLALAWKPQEAWFVAFPEQRAEAASLLARFQPHFTNPAVEKIGHNLKFDIGVLLAHGCDIAGPIFDTMLAASIVLPDSRRTMDALAVELLNYQPQPISELIGEKGKDQKTLREVPLADVVEYAGEDADITLQLAEELREKLANDGVEKVMYEIEAPLAPVLARMEHAGINMDVAALSDLSNLLGGQIQEDEAEIYALAGEEFNLNSPKQLGTILFDKLQLSSYARKTKTGQYKTDEGVLTRLAARHEIARRILNFRMRSKLKSTYVDALPTNVDAGTGRVHTHYEQAVTATGRLQSHDPNLQNIPIRSEQGKEIRRAFVAASADYQLLAADYSQIELRIAAHMSGDENLQNVFARGEDVHTATAAQLYGVDVVDVDSDMRRQAKTVNFSILFGVTPFGLAERMGIPRGEGKELIESYYAAFPDLKRWMDETIAFAQEHGYVETLMGRRRYLRDINSRNGNVRQAAERLAINSPVQGTEADLIKMAMCRIDSMLREKDLKSRMLLQVHDELVFDLHRDEADWLPEAIAESMRDALPLAVPVEVELGIADNWLDAH